MVPLVFETQFNVIEPSSVHRSLLKTTRTFSLRDLAQATTASYAFDSKEFCLDKSALVLFGMKE